MASTTTSTGTATSFTSTPQAKDDSYTFTEDSLLTQSGLYDDATGTLTLNVMSNDLGGVAKTIYSIADGDGNPITADFELLLKDTQDAGFSAWEQTSSGNWIRINNGVSVSPVCRWRY